MSSVPHIFTNQTGTKVSDTATSDDSYAEQ